MPTLTEVLGAQSYQQPDAVAGLNESMKTAVGLATMKEQVEQQKVAVEQQKQNLADKKFQSFVGGLQTYIRSSPAVRKKLRPKIEDGFRARDLAVDTLLFDEIDNDPEYENNLRAVMAGIQTGDFQVDPVKALQTAQDAGLLKETIETMQLGKKQDAQMTIAELKNQATLAKVEAAAAKAEGAVERGDTKIRFEAREKVKKSFDSQIKDDTLALEAALDAEKLLSTGGAIADSAAKSKVARMFEKGVLTDADLNRLSGSKALYDRGQELVQQLMTGNLSDTNRAELYKITQSLKPLVARRIQERKLAEATAGEKIYEGRVSKDDLLGVLDAGNQVDSIYSMDQLMKDLAAEKNKKKAPPPPNEKGQALRALKNKDGSPRYTEEQIAALLKGV